MTMKVSKEDLRRALCLPASATLSNATFVGNDVVFSYEQGAGMNTLERGSMHLFANAINSCIAHNKEIELVYDGSTDIRTFFPMRWVNSYTIEGLDLDKDDIRRFSMDKIARMSYPM